ncbi:MAG: glycosyltransferase family 2 protein [Lachnospiraceae bacterium]|nr:glycosyltransferase family 2 protein [Lachnospiraceae bacterium]
MADNTGIPNRVSGKRIEIIVPCYNEEQCIEAFFDETSKVLDCLEGYTYSFLYINDGSKDSTLSKIKSLVDRYGDDKVKYISFARNFGKEAAIYAGFENSIGDYVALMDADLQHPPTLLPQMIEKIEGGHDCCGARRISRKGEPVIRSFFSKAFYRIINNITAMNLVQGGSDYRMMTKQMVKAIVSLSERERFIKGIMSWVGFDTVWISYENVERYAGTTKWSFMGLIRYAWHGFISFATTPLRAVVWLGFIVVLSSVIYGIRLAYMSLAGIRPWQDTTTILMLLVFFSGVVICILGIIGEYMARIYLELKGRPIYISKETNIQAES